MNATPYIGIDYGLEHSNIDKATGTRYGVISFAYRYVFGSDGVYSDKVVSWTYQHEGYTLQTYLDSTEVLVIASPYYTYAQFCSPCVPRAGTLDTPLSEDSGAPKTYCLDRTWFYDEQCPYPYWVVGTGELAYSPQDED